MKRKLAIIALFLVLVVSLTLAACQHKQYYAIFNTNGGTAVETQSLSVLESEPQTTREGYIFEGWYLTPDFSGGITYPFKLTRDTTFYAKWTEKAAEETKYIVNFAPNNGEFISASYTAQVDEAPAVTRDGYTLAGWYEDPNFGGNVVTFPYKVTANVTLYARWIPVTAGGFTLTFESNGGTSYTARQNQTIITASDMPTPAKSGVAFLGWYLNDACTQALPATYTLTRDTTLYAKWDEPVEIYFSIHFVDGGNTLTVDVNGTPTQTTLDTATQVDVYRNKPYITALDGSSITVAAPARENATFKGWYTEENPEDESSKVTFPFTLDGNRVFYAKWIVDVTPTPEDSALLQTYLNQNVYQTYVAGYGLLVKNSRGTVSQTFAQNYYSPDKVISYEYLWDANANLAGGAWMPAYIDFAFKRADPNDYWMVYTDTGDKSGSYQFGNLWYNADVETDLEEAFLMVYLSAFDQIDASKFYRYDGRWYATEDYVDEVGHLLLGNASGKPSVYSITYSELALTFGNSGALARIDVKSNVVDSFSYGNGIAVTNYYYTHDIQIWAADPQTDPDSLLNIDESQFLQDQTRPNGLYPELNPDDANRNNVTGDGNAYTTEQLQSALSELNQFTAYYTLAGNTFSGFVYQPATITVNGNYGTVKYDAYAPYAWGDVASAEQTARDAWYFKFDGSAFFLAVKETSGYGVYCSQYSYKNNYLYNQYLLGDGNSINFNCTYPASIKYLNASKFQYNAAGGYFEFAGDADEMKQVGQMLFGDMDYAYPEASETEHYTYLRLFMSGGKLVKVVAAATIELFGESSEYFIKEVVIKSQTAAAVTMPAGIEAQMILPGEAMVGGSVASLQSAIDSTKGANHKYADKFVFDDDDELGGVGYYGHEESGDVYLHYNGLTKVNSNLYVYFKDGRLYQQYAGGSGAEAITLDSGCIGNDVDKANSYILWAYSMAELLDVNWFYQGKDGRYYGKSEYMDKLSWAIGRYSGCEQYLEQYASMRFGVGYRWSVVLDFVSVSLYGGKLESIYYSGVILVKGSAGQYTKPFSGYATFSYDGTPVTLPSADTADAARPAVYQYINADYDFSVDHNGILHIAAVPNAASYKAYVYNLTNDTLVAEFAVTNGMDLKTVAALNVGADVKDYRLAIQALGNGTTYLDGVKSGLVAIELSTVPKHAAPEVDFNRAAATITVSGNYPAGTYYRYEIYQTKRVSGSNVLELVAGGNNAITKALDLNNLPDGVTLNAVHTYTISIWVLGTNGVIRNSETVTLSYTTPKVNGESCLNDLFGAIDYTKSFSVSLSAQDRYRYHYFDHVIDGIELMDASKTWLDANRSCSMDMSMYFEASLNRGKLTFVFKDISYKTLFEVTFRFNKIGEQLVGQYTKTVGGEAVESKTLTTGLLFAGVADLADGFTELSGDVNVWSHLAHRYTADITSEQTQSAIASLTILDEIFGALTYTAMQLNMGYDSYGALSSNTCSLALAANTEDGHSLIVSFCFSRFGENLTRWVND